MLSKKSLTRIGVGFLGFLVLFITAVYAEWKIVRNRGQALLDSEIAKLDAEDPDWRAADLCSKRNASLPPKERNSAARADEAYKLIPESYRKWLQREIESSYETVGVLSPKDDLDAVHAKRSEAMAAIRVARTLRDLPAGGAALVYKEPEPIGTLLTSTQNLRTIASLLDIDALVLAHSGDGNSAIRSTHAILNTARAVGDEPMLISTLIRIAITTIACRNAQRTLGWTEPKAGLEELQTAFADEIAVPRLTYGLRGERAMTYLSLTNMDNGTYEADSEEGRQGRLGSAPFRKTIPKQQFYMLDLLNKMIAAEKLTGKERIAAFAAVQPPPPGGIETVLVGLLAPSIQKSAAAEDRCRAILGTTVIALACERFRLANGRFPNSVAEIPEAILPSVPDDPFTGDPLRFQFSDDEIVVYSLGPDRLDGGGQNLDLTAKVGGDIGFKLLHPSKRRQPAPQRPSVPAEEPLDP